VSGQHPCSLAVIGAAGELELGSLAPLFAEVVLCVDPPLAPHLKTSAAHPAASMVGPLVKTSPAGRPLALLTAALTVCRTEHVVAVDAAQLGLLRPETLARLTGPLSGDEGDVILLDLSHNEVDGGAGHTTAGLTPGRYGRGCRRALERALRRGRYEPTAALKGLRIVTIRDA